MQFDMPDQEAYSAWIMANVTGDPHGTCKQVTERMALAFPELHRVRGHYCCPIEGRQTHWWLVAPDGAVIDPTRTQFASEGHGVYEPHIGAEPTGKCLNCGEYAYDHATFCSSTCTDEFAAHIQQESE